MFKRFLVVLCVVLVVLCLCSCNSENVSTAVSFEEEPILYAPGQGMIPPVEAQSWTSDSFTEVGSFTMEGNNFLLQ